MDITPAAAAGTHQKRRDVPFHRAHERHPLTRSRLEERIAHAIFITRFKNGIRI